MLGRAAKAAWRLLAREAARLLLLLLLATWHAGLAGLAIWGHAWRAWHGCCCWASWSSPAWVGAECAWRVGAGRTTRCAWLLAVGCWWC